MHYQCIQSHDVASCILLTTPRHTPPVRTTQPWQVGVIFGNPETTAGGQALKFYASQRVDLRAKERVKSADGKTETGIRVKAKVVKNKVAPPYK